MRFGRREQPKMNLGKKAGEIVSSAAERKGGVTEIATERFWGDEIGYIKNNMRIVYNNVKGLQIGNFLKSKTENEIKRKKWVL